MIRCVQCRGPKSSPRPTLQVCNDFSKQLVRSLDMPDEEQRWIMAITAHSTALELAGWCANCVLEAQVLTFPGFERPKMETTVYPRPYKPRLQVVPSGEPKS